MWEAFVASPNMDFPEPEVAARGIASAGEDVDGRGSFLSETTCVTRLNVTDLRRWRRDSLGGILWHGVSGVGCPFEASSSVGV